MATIPDPYVPPPPLGARLAGRIALAAAIALLALAPLPVVRTIEAPGVIVLGREGLEFHVHVGEADAVRLRPGVTARIRLPALGRGEELTGKISRVGHDEEGFSVQVPLTRTIADDGKPILVGLRGRARLELGKTRLYAWVLGREATQ